MRFEFTPDGPNRCAGSWIENRGPGYKGYAQGVSIGGLIGMTVATQGGVPATITTNEGTLQMVATVVPATANQSVTWSIVPGTGMASINAAGLVTAISDGTAYAKATAVQDTTVKDSLMITMSGQIAQPPAVVTIAATGVTSSVATLNGTVNANSLTTDVFFDWGLTSSYGNTVAAVPSTVTGATATPVLLNISSLQSLTTYHFRVKGSSYAGTRTGEDMTFTTSPGVGVPDKAPLKADIYPVPNDGQFNIFIKSASVKTFSLVVYNNLGSEIFSNSNLNSNGTGAIAVDLRPIPAGIYTIILRSSGEQVVYKMVVNK